jgi:hypothetical protein
MTSKRQRRADWITEHAEAINTSRKTTSDHSQCKGSCNNGATCKTQSDGGYGFWVQAFRLAGVECSPRNYWSGSAPTPSTSINKGIADYLHTNAPKDLF